MRNHSVWGKQITVLFLIIVFFFGYTTFFSKFTSASSSATLEKVSDIGDGGESDVFVVGTLAYVTCGWGGLKVYNISNPSSPEFLGEIDEIGNLHSVWVVGDYAYLAAGKQGFIIVNVSNIEEMSITDTIPTTQEEEYAAEIEVQGDYAYVAYTDFMAMTEGNGKLSIYDISNPFHINVISEYNAWDFNVNQIDVNGSYVYASNIFRNRLEVINVSNIYSPSVIGTYKDDAEYRSIVDITVVGDLVLVGNVEDGLEIINVTDPDNPFEMGNYTGSSVYGVTGNENYAFIAGNTGLTTIDITDPSNPVYVSYKGGPDYAAEVLYASNLVYLTRSTEGMGIFDVTNPTSPSLLSIINEGMNPCGITFQENNAYFGCSEGLFSINITNPETPEIVGSWNEPLQIRYVGSSPGYCYGIVYSDLYVIDNETMEEVESLPLRSNSRMVAVDENISVVVSSSSGDNNHYYTIINISDPLNPGNLSETLIEQEDFYFCELQISGNILYLVGKHLNDQEEIYTIDLSDPSNPIEKSRYLTDSFIAMHVHGNYAYLTDVDGLTVLDVSNSSSPRVCSEYTPPIIITKSYLMTEITVFDDFAFIQTEEGIAVFDVYDKSDIQCVGYLKDDSLKDGFFIDGIEYHDGYLYYTSHVDGMEILKVTLDATDRYSMNIPGFPIAILAATLFGVATILVLSKYKK